MQSGLNQVALTGCPSARSSRESGERSGEAVRKVDVLLLTLPALSVFANRGARSMSGWHAPATSPACPAAKPLDREEHDGAERTSGGFAPSPRKPSLRILGNEVAIESQGQRREADEASQNRLHSRRDAWVHRGQHSRRWPPSSTRPKLLQGLRRPRSSSPGRPAASSWISARTMPVSASNSPMRASREERSRRPTSMSASRTSQGGIVIFLCTNLTPPRRRSRPTACPTLSGMVTGTRTTADVRLEAAQRRLRWRILSTCSPPYGKAQAYANVHSICRLSPAGEIRDQNQVSDHLAERKAAADAGLLEPSGPGPGGRSGARRSSCHPRGARTA